MTFTKVFKSPLIEYKIKWSRTTKINSFPAPISFNIGCSFQPFLIVYYFNSALMAHYSEFQDKKYRPLNRFKGRIYVGCGGVQHILPKILFYYRGFFDC